jgi:hypothetical protein
MSNINQTTALPQDGTNNQYNRNDEGTKFNSRENPIAKKGFNNPNARGLSDDTWGTPSVWRPSNRLAKDNAFRIPFDDYPENDSNEQNNSTFVE